MKKAYEWARREGLLEDPDVLVKYLNHRLKHPDMEESKSIVELRKEISQKHREHFTVEEIEAILTDILYCNTLNDVQDKIIAIAESENLTKIRKLVDMQ